jgi:hypothetical protein
VKEEAAKPPQETEDQIAASGRSARARFADQSVAIIAGVDSRPGNETNLASLRSDGNRRTGGSMKQAREATPLWVWIAFVLVGVGIVAYVVGYSMFEDIIAFLG